MQLKELQSLIAKLSSDSNFLTDFLNNPQYNEFSEEQRLQIQFFIKSLIHKRLHEVQKLLPRTYSLLKDKFNQNFFQFVEKYTLTKKNKHLNEAISFTNYLQLQTQPFHNQPPFLQNLIKFEATRLKLHQNQLFIFQIYRYPVHIIKQPTQIQKHLFIAFRLYKSMKLKTFWIKLVLW